MELTKHPFFFGVQFHPEFSSTPEKNDAGFVAFITAATKFKK
jgi:CTP synthase